MKRGIMIGAAAVFTAVIIYVLLPSQKIDFNTQVKPIINKKCIACHGGVKRESEFSLLFRTDAMAKAESGKLAIIPGNASGSELIRRINSLPEALPGMIASFPLSALAIASVRNNKLNSDSRFTPP